MPELVPVWQELVALAGGTDRAGRMLSLYCPPPYMAGCSQLLWTRDEPALVRNYDYRPERYEGLMLHSSWRQTPVIASVDSVWGALDGMNANGLAVSLAFGGRSIVGIGFGIPLILRYVLETCATTAEALSALLRLPCHMSYTVSVIDRASAAATVFLNPDRPARAVPDLVATNHQGQVEWPEYAAITGTVVRHAELARLVADPYQTLDSVTARFVQPPLRAYDRARRTATLYTVAYRPSRGQVDVIWPTASWRLSFGKFPNKTARITL